MIKAFDSGGKVILFRTVHDVPGFCTRSLYSPSGEQAGTCLSRIRELGSVRWEFQSHSASLRAIAQRSLGGRWDHVVWSVFVALQVFRQVPGDQVKISILMSACHYVVLYTYKQNALSFQVWVELGILKISPAPPLPFIIPLAQFPSLFTLPSLSSCLQRWRKSKQIVLFHLDAVIGLLACSVGNSQLIRCRLDRDGQHRNHFF